MRNKKGILSLVLLFFVIVSYGVSVVSAPTWEQFNVETHSSFQDAQESIDPNYFTKNLELNFTAPASLAPYVVFASAETNGAGAPEVKFNNTIEDTIGYCDFDTFTASDRYSFSTMAVRNLTGSQSFGIWSYHSGGGGQIRNMRIMAIRLTQLNSYHYAQNQTQGSAINQTWYNQTICSFTVDSTSSGNHLIVASSEIRSTLYGGHRVRLLTNGSSPEELAFMELSPNALSTVNPFAIKVKNLAPANYTVVNEFSNTGIGYYTYINRSRIFVASLRGAGSNWFYAESEGVTQSTSQSDITKVTYDFTPTVSGTYLFLASFEKNVTAPHVIDIDIYNETAIVQNDYIQQTYDDWQNYGNMKPENLNASMSDLTYRILFSRGDPATGVAEMRRTRIFLWLPQYWLEYEDYVYPLRLTLGLLGLAIMVISVSYGVYEVKENKNYEGIISAFILLVIGYALTLCWLVP